MNVTMEAVSVVQTKTVSMLLAATDVLQCVLKDLNWFLESVWVCIDLPDA